MPAKKTVNVHYIAKHFKENPVEPFTKTAKLIEKIFSNLDDSMLKITKARATFGALQSRLNSTIASIDVGSENLSAAQSRIRDVDYGSESARFTQNRILVAAGTAVLAQANQLPEHILHLIG